MYDKRYFKVGDVVRFQYNGYVRSGKVVKLTDRNVTITYTKLGVKPTDDIELHKIKSFTYAFISGLETLEMAP